MNSQITGLVGIPVEFYAVARKAVLHQTAFDVLSSLV
jgi:hypothetical protein